MPQQSVKGGVVLEEWNIAVLQFFVAGWFNHAALPCKGKSGSESLAMESISIMKENSCLIIGC